MLMKESCQSHRIVLAAAEQPQHKGRIAKMMNNSDISAAAISCAASASAYRWNADTQPRGK